MPGVIASLPKFQFSANGVPMVGGTLTSYIAGTTTPATTWQDAALTIANTNPITLDSRGECVLWLDSTVIYKFILKNESGVVQWTQDNINSAAPLRSDLATAIGASLIGGVNQVVASIAGLRALLKTSASKNAFVTGYYAAGDGGGGAYYFDSADITTADNGGSLIVASDGGRWKLQPGSSVSVAQWGIIGDGVRDNTARMAALCAWAALKTAAGNTVKITWPAGRYNYTASPNWAISRLHMAADGEVWLINNGTGDSFTLDGGATGAGVYGMKITGDFKIYGLGTTGHGVYWRAVHRSDVALNVRGAGTGSSGLYMAWGVSNTIRFVMSVNEGGLYAVPSRCMTLTQRAVNEQSSYNTFTNGEWAGAPIGAYLDAALGNTFNGGAFQANSNIGAQLTVNSWNNKFIGCDFEVNTNVDISDDGRNNSFIDCDTATLIQITANALHPLYLGGEHQSIQVFTGATRARLSSLTYNRFGSGSLVDSGTQTRLRDNVNKIGGVVENTPRAKTTVSVGASPFTYTNTTGGEADLLILGGTVSQLVYTRFSGDVIPYSAASGVMLRLSPGDAISLTYTVAPSLISYTR